MFDGKVLPTVQWFTASLSAANALSVFVEKAHEHGPTRSAFSGGPLRLRLWVSAIVLLLLGVATVGLLFYRRRSYYSDYRKDAQKRQIVMLFAGLGEALMGLVFVALLLVFP